MLKPYQYILETSKDEYEGKNIVSTTNPVIRIGIQARPGTKFIINNSDSHIEIGISRIYELNLDGLGFKFL